VFEWLGVSLIRVDTLRNRSVWNVDLNWAVGSHVV
jgi:hypothetical protein